MSSLVNTESTNLVDANNSIREIMQEIVLSGLSRSGFFNHAAFHGGTALRIFHDLDRFSEDLDFCIIDPDYAVDIEFLAGFVDNELAANGIEAKIDKDRQSRNIKSCQVVGKTVDILTTFGFNDRLIASVDSKSKIRIKMDIDLEVPDGYILDHRLRDYPFHYSATLLDKPSLFAAKTSAVICRHWRNRVKGRDFYDFEWYINNSCPMNRTYLANNLMREGLVDEPYISKEKLLEILRNRFETVDLDSALDDISAFVRLDKIHDWSPEHFINLSERIRFTDE